MHLFDTCLFSQSAAHDVPILHFPKSGEGLRRRKREWVIPVISRSENDKGPFPLKISQVRGIKTPVGFDVN